MGRSIKPRKDVCCKRAEEQWVNKCLSVKAKKVRDIMRPVVASSLVVLDYLLTPFRHEGMFG